MRGVLAAGLSVGLAAAVVGTAVLASAVSLLGVRSGAPAASSAATDQIPPAMLTLYQEAADTCPGLPWTILAAIGTVESDNGQSNLPGVHSGANAAGAEGFYAVRAVNIRSMAYEPNGSDLQYQAGRPSPTTLDIAGTPPQYGRVTCAPFLHSSPITSRSATACCT
jgi:hypothetical protein